MRSKISLTIAVISLAAALIFFSCSKTSDSKPNGTSNTVSISNFTFVSDALTTTKGTTVTWTNNDTAPHTVTADDNSFTSDTLNKGDAYSHPFNTIGTFNYHCNIHQMMKASVIVK